VTALGALLSAKRASIEAAIGVFLGIPDRADYNGELVEVKAAAG